MDNTQEPLTRIRRAEVSVIRRIALMQEEYERIRADAQAQATAILETARAQAERDGQSLREESRTQVRREAQAVLAEARVRVDGLACRGQVRRNEAVERALRFILGEQEPEI